MIDLITITGPASEPVTTAEAKTHLRVDVSDEDTYIDSLISVARFKVENRTGFRLIDQTTELRADSFDDGDLANRSNKDIIKLRVAPIIAVSSVKYDDTDDVEQTLSTSEYWTDTLSVPARIMTKSSWPSTEDKIGAVRIRMNTGYANAAAVPDHFKLCIKLLVAHYFEHRSEIDQVKMEPIPEGIDSILTSRGEYMIWQM